MVKRKSRKSILYRPKGKGKGKAKAKVKNGGDGNVPAWDKMHLFGAFSINDKDDDNLKYRFRRGDIATILPSHKAPGESIEPHEYWVGKILEIRADQGGMNSEQIWTKVQWLYSAEEAKDLIPSLDTSPFGKFERIWSNHWDFILPHAFNEVISLPRLLTFPRHSPTSSILLLQQPLSCPPKPLVQQNQYQRGASLLSSCSTLTTITTTTTTGGGGSSSSTTMTTVTSGADESTSAVASTMQNLMAQRVIGPDEFYWRYNLSVEERTLDPQPVSQSNCICSNPYLPDEDSLRGGVMIYCPRQSCRTGYHLGCLEDVKCVWVERISDDDGEVNVVDIDVDVEEIRDEEDGDDEEDEEWLSKRAIRRISTSPNSNNAYIDLLSLLNSQHHKTKTQTSKLTMTNETERGDDAGQVSSLLERVYDRQLEQYYLYSQSKSHPSQPHQKKRKKPKLTSNSLIASLFILPPPFPPNSTSPLPFSKTQRQRQRQRQRRQQCELHLLLALASQPLIRGGGYFDELGPTGNVNSVLCAREFVWEVMSRIGELDFRFLVREGEGEGGRGGGDEEEEEQERKDREDFSRIRECVENVLDRYREKFFSLTKTDDNNNITNETTGDHPDCSGMKDSVLPPDVSIEDAIVIKKGLLFFDYLHRSRKGKIPRTRTNSTATSDVDEDEDVDEDSDAKGDIDAKGIGVKMKEEPQSDVDIVEETEAEGEEGEDEDDTNVSADEVDDILLANPRKRKGSVTTVSSSGRRRNRDQTRKKRRKGVGILRFGEGGADDNDGGNEEVVVEKEVDVEQDTDEEEEENTADKMLLNVDWACPECGGSI